MPQNDVETRPRRFKLSRWQIASIAIALLILLFLAWRLLLDWMVDRKISLLHADGLPTTLQEMNDLYVAVPADKNAALLYEQAFAFLYVDPVVDNDRESFAAKMLPNPKPWEPWPSQWTEHCGSYFDKNKQTLEIVNSASKLTESRYTVDYRKIRDPHFAWGQHYGIDRHLIQLINYRALYAAEIGDSKSAAHWIGRGLDVQESLASEPVEIAYLVRISLSAENIETIERVLNRTQLNDAQLTTLATRLDAIVLDARIQRSVDSEIAAVIDNFQHLNQDSIQLGHVYFQLYDLSGMAQIDELQCLSSMQQARTSSTLAPDARRKAISDLDHRADLLPKPYVISREIYYSNYFDTIDKAVARLACLRTVVAVERYRLAHHNKLPESLADLLTSYLPNIPLDPFGEKPLTYLVSPEGYTVQSTGVVNKNPIQVTVHHPEKDVALPATFPATMPASIPSP